MSAPRSRPMISGRRYCTLAALCSPRAPAMSRSKHAMQKPIFAGLPSAVSTNAARPVTIPARMTISFSFFIRSSHHAEHGQVIIRYSRKRITTVRRNADILSAFRDPDSRITHQTAKVNRNQFDIDEKLTFSGSTQSASPCTTRCSSKKRRTALRTRFLSALHAGAIRSRLAPSPVRR